MGLRGKTVGIVMVVVFGLLAVAPLLIPAAAWIPRLEAEAGRQLGTQVRIGGLRLALLPLPHVTVQGLDIAAGAITAGSIAVYPRLGSLLSEKRVVRSIELDQVVVSPKGADLLAALAGKKGGSGAGLEVQRLRARSIQVELAAGKLPAFNADIALNGGAGLPVESALVTTMDGKARAALLPDGRDWKLTFEGSDWQLPFGPQLHFNSLNAGGRLSGEKLVVNDIAGALYGGKVVGKAELAWQKGWRLTGDIRTEGLDIMQATQALNVRAALSGKLDASGPFSAQSAKPAGLADSFVADIGFEVRNGVLHGFDLASAAQSLLKGGAGGGNTQFDRLTGKVKVLGRAYKLQNVKVTSGVLKAEGNVDISASKQLSGRVDTEVKGTAGLVGVPVAVSGTLDHPILLPTKGSMAGAVVGTVLLPGVGTSIGSSVGDKIGKMFGK
jgi:hypothetical protein